LPDAVAATLEEEDLDAVVARVAVHEALDDLAELVPDLTDAPLVAFGVDQGEGGVAWAVAVRVLQLFGHEVAQGGTGHLGPARVRLGLGQGVHLLDQRVGQRNADDGHGRRCDDWPRCYYRCRPRTRRL